MALRISSPASDMSFLKSKMMTMRALLSEAVERISYTCGMLCSAFSTRLMISRSTVSGDAPGYGKLTHHHRLLDVRDLVDAQILERQQPQAHEHDDDRNRGHRLLDAEIGEEHDSTSPRSTAPLGTAVERSPRWPSFSVRRSGSAAPVAFGEAACHGVLHRCAHRARPDRRATFCKLAVLDAPGEGVVALAHHRGGRQRQRGRAARFDAAFGIQPGHVRLLFRRRRSSPALRPGASWRWRRGSRASPCR